MKKIYVQIVNTLNGISQTGMIEEPVIKGQEIQNTLKHFGIVYGEITWNSDFINKDVANHPKLLTGSVDGANKIVNVVVLDK